ncbi:MAG: hypothetical protein QOE71_3747 [Pseudonocardiales bacterium]|nr:hypothetical protein [Pseudonocardiales bacterium]
MAMARNPVADVPRNVIVQLRLTPSEVQRIDQQRNNTSRSAYLRSLIPGEDSVSIEPPDIDVAAVVEEPMLKPSGRHFHSPGELIGTTTSNGREMRRHLCADPECTTILER